MKPGDHPEFFKRPPPDGRSRESTIRLDREGRFWHEGELVTHPGMQQAFASWIARHPDDGRFVLNNGYDWTYFTVDDVPYFVRTLRIDQNAAKLVLTDGTEELLDPASLRIGASDAIYVRVKDGRFDARFFPEAQTKLAPLIVEGADGRPAIELGGVRYPILERHQ
jgi:hypothetical protein